MANSGSAAIHVQCLSASSTHDFEASYVLLDGMGVGEYVNSPIFRVGGHDWSIRLYPAGWKKDCEGNASVYLEFRSKEKDVKTKFTINLLKKGVQATNFDAIEYVFSSPEKACQGFFKFVQKSKLKSLSSFSNGCFMLRCDLTVLKKSQTEGKVRNLVVVPKPNMHVHLEHMLEEEEGADVSFSVGDQTFRAHRYVLAARSPVFKAELFGLMKEKTAECIKIDGIEPSIFMVLLHFIYTDFIPDDFDEGNIANVQHLLVAADRYEVDRLKAMCEANLCKSIGVDMVATTLVIADQHHLRRLRETCIGFMASRDNLGPVMQTDGFKHLVASCPMLMEDILKEMARG